MKKPARSRRARPAPTPRGPDLVRSLALALPGVTEQDHFGRPSFRIGKKIFATLWESDGLAVLMLTPDQQDELTERAPEIFWPVHGSWGWRGATHMKIAGRGAASRTVIALALELAWSKIAPKKLRPVPGADDPPRRGA